MGIIAKWFNEEQSAVHHIYEGRWAWEEVYAAIDETIQMMNTVNHRVDFIIDVQNASMLPANASSQFSRLRKIFDHPNAGRPVIVGANRLLKMFAEIFVKVSSYSKLEFQFVLTLEEAHALLQAERGSAG